MPLSVRWRLLGGRQQVPAYTFNMVQVLKAACEVITVLFAIGVIGCLVVIPITAFQWVKAVFEPDTEEEMARSLSRPMRSSDAG